MSIDHKVILQAVSLLKAGKLVAIPTETVYGLGADALNFDAIQKIYAVKGRPSTNPLIIHLPNLEAMTDWAIHIPDNAWKLAEVFWPGPMTLILLKHPRVPHCVTGNQETVGLRVPNHPTTLALLEAFKGGIAAPSANRYGRISPTTAEHVREELGDKVDFILDGGPCQIGIESTIISMMGEEPVILRQGSISETAIIDILGLKILHTHNKNRDQEKIQVPGQSESHYAPSKPLYLLEKDNFDEAVSKFHEKNNSFNAMAFSEKPSVFSTNSTDKVTWILASPDPNQYAQDLYSNLRRLDHAEGDCILVEAPPTHPAWLAIKDRLQRASSRV